MTNEELTIVQHNIFISHCEYYKQQNTYNYSCDKGLRCNHCIPTFDCREHLSEEGKNKYDNITRKLKLLKLMCNDK